MGLLGFRRDSFIGQESGGSLASKAETRSDITNLGDLKSGRLHLILGDSASGQPVNESTAVGVPAVTACVSLLADMVAKLPIYLYQDNGRVPKEITNHPAIDAICKNYGEFHTSFELRRLMETGRGLGGNGYARIFRNSYGDPETIQWVKPSDVTPMEVRKPNGERMVAYKIDGEPNILTRYDIIHVKGFSEDGIVGKSPITMLREQIGTALSQTKAAGRLMQNGAKFSGMIVAEGVKNKEQLDDIRDEVNSKMAGVINAGKIPVVGGGTKWENINGMSMVDAQFVDSRRFELQEIARLYRIPAYMIGDTTASTTWGTGIQEQTLGFLNFCLDPHLVCWEQSLAMSLLTTEEIKAGYFFKFDRDELVNASLEAKASYYSTMRNIGVFSPNDIRAKQGEPLIPADQGGDDYGKPLNANIAASNAPAPAEEPEPETAE